VRHERVEDREHGAEEDRGASLRLGGHHEADGRERRRRYQENERRVSEEAHLTWRPLIASFVPRRF
jgi:hypothetical protein